MKSKLILTSFLTVIMTDIAFAGLTGNACMNENGHDPLVGVWYGSFIADPGTNREYLGYGTVTFNADGTAMAGDTTNTGGLGNLATAPTGIWSKTSPMNYKITAITIYSSTATLPAPTAPVYTFVEHANVKLSDDCMTINSHDDKYAIFLPSDFNFERPLASGTLSQTYKRITHNTAN